MVKVTPNFCECAPEKNFLHALFSRKPPTNCTSIERLWDVEFNKIMFCFGDCFLKAAEAVNAKMIDWHYSELIGYQMWLLILSNCTVLITKHLCVTIFLYFYWLSFYRSVNYKFHYWTISKRCCVRGHHEKSISNKRIRRHTFVPYLSV